MRVLVMSFAAAVALSGCVSPLQKCLSTASRDLRVVDGLIAESMENLARGYAIEKRPAVRTGLELCISPDDPFLFCTSRDVTVEEKAVAIDVADEEAKLRSLRTKRAELAARAELATEQCQAQHPSG